LLLLTSHEKRSAALIIYNPLQSTLNHEQAEFAASFLLVIFLVYYSTLKMEAMCSSETSVNFYQATRHRIPEDTSVHSHRCENLKYKITGSI
jgi:hypothetical protein